MRTGSLLNHYYGNGSDHVPTVGMGATVLMWSDRHAATVIEVSKSGREVTIQQDKATRVDTNGMSDAQQYTYEKDENGQKGVYTLRKNGAWVRKGADMKNGERIALGVRDEYYDFSF